jgi:hypothetical protein
MAPPEEVVVVILERTAVLKTYIMLFGCFRQIGLFINKAPPCPLNLQFNLRCAPLNRFAFSNFIYLSLMAQDLPPGWEQRFDKQGRPYYFDVYTKKTTWTDPRTSDKGTKYRNLEQKDHHYKIQRNLL